MTDRHKVVETIYSEGSHKLPDTISELIKFLETLLDKVPDSERDKAQIDFDHDEFTIDVSAYYYRRETDVEAKDRRVRKLRAMRREVDFHHTQAEWLESELDEMKD